MVAFAAALFAPPRLLGLAALCALALSGGALAAFLKLLKRGRWLWLGLLLVYSWTTPGMPLWPALGAMGPSDHGLALGALQMLRLLCVLAALAWALHGLDRGALVLGLLTLARPLAWLGLPVERFAVRLALVLENVEQGRMLDLSEIARFDPPAAGPDHVGVPRQPLRALDGLALALALFGLAALA